MENSTDSAETQSPSGLHEPIGTLPPEKQQQIMARLWRRMAAIYGQGRWLSHAPASSDLDPGVTGEWLAMLQYKSMQDIARGIERYEADPGQHPPGAAEFRKACREFAPGTFAGASKPPPLPSVADMLEGATVTGSARGWIAWCQAVADGEGLTRRQLEQMPGVMLTDGTLVRAADECKASDDEEASA